MSGVPIRQARFTASSTACQILLVRHGESEAAAPDGSWPTVMGHGNPGLHPHGRLQARRVAARLSGEDLAAIYVTPFTRTQDTAAPLLEATGMEALTEPDLREVYLGEWESPIFRKHIADGHPLARRIFDEERWDLAPGAEPADAFAARVRSAVLRIATIHAGTTVAVFTHAGVIGRVLAEATGSRPFAFNGADNASISHVVVDGDKWALRVFNDSSHLSPILVGAPELPWDVEQATVATAEAAQP